MEERMLEPQKPKNRKVFGLSCCFVLVAIMGILYNQYGNSNPQKEESTGGKASLTNDYLQSICPFQMAGIGKVRTISINDNVVTLHFFVTEVEDTISIDVSTIKKNEERAIDLAMTEVQGAKEDLREVISLIAQKGMSLCFDIKGDNGGNGVITLTNQQIKEALDRLPFANDSEFSLHAIANTNRMLLPIQVDAITEWVDVELNKNDYIYVYTIDDSQLNLNSIDLKAWKESMYEKLKENREDLKNIIEGCAYTKRGIIYRYVSKWTKESIGIHIWPEELEYMDDEVEEYDE